MLYYLLLPNTYYFYPLLLLLTTYSFPRTPFDLRNYLLLVHTLHMTYYHPVTIALLITARFCLLPTCSEVVCYPHRHSVGWSMPNLLNTQLFLDERGNALCPPLLPNVDSTQAQPPTRNLPPLLLRVRRRRCGGGSAGNQGCRSRGVESALCADAARGGRLCREGFATLWFGRHVVRSKQQPMRSK